MRTDILERKDEILQWITEQKPKSFMCKELHCKNETLNSYLKQMDIEYHGAPGVNNKSERRYKSATEYIKGTTVKSAKLRDKLFIDGIKQRQCENCGLSEWMGQPMPLELHHIDEDHFNNNLNNLQILCPNCHALLGNKPHKYCK